jgi:hypothetical protein
MVVAASDNDKVEAALNIRANRGPCDVEFATSSTMSSNASDEIARGEAVYETQIIYSRYQQQLNAEKKKSKGPPCWNCVVNVACN